MSEKSKGREIIIYEDKNGKVELRADVQHDTIWATQAQIAEVFSVNIPAISKHIKNILKKGELLSERTVSKMEIVQNEGERMIRRPVEHYNLDMIIAVGYRVNSKKATQFRIWATTILRNHLLKGYTLNKKRLENTQVKLGELNKMICFITNVRNKQLTSDEASGLLTVIKDYTDSWTLLHEYDSRKLKVRKSKKKVTELEYEEVQQAIFELKVKLVNKNEAGDFFGQERGDGLSSILKNIQQTFGGKELYGSLEEKAAHLLYFVIKDHPLIDGNKRSAALLFILFLQKNLYLFRTNGERKINDNTLTALALLIAESRPEEKEQMIALITQLLK